MPNNPTSTTTVATMNVKGITRYTGATYTGNVNGRVLFKPYSALGDIWVDQENNPIIMQTVEARLDNGVLKDSRGEVGVSLYSSNGFGDSNPPKNQWTAIFLDVTVDGIPALMDEVLFDAIPNTYVNLADYVPVPGVDNNGVVRGPKGTTIDSITVEGSNLVLWETVDGVKKELGMVDLGGFSKESARVGAVQAADAVRSDLILFRDAAASSATAAAASESKAKTSETNAKTSETKAKTSETNAKTSETRAKTSETNAKTSETNAKTSETNAFDVAQSASYYAITAASEADRATSSAASASSSKTDAAMSATTASQKASDATAQADRAKSEADRAAETASSGMPDATAATKGKLALSGDLAGTADAPTVPGLKMKADLVGGMVPTSQLPAVALTKPFVVPSRAAMLALPAQEGDVAVITAGTDKGSYMLGTGASTTFASWVKLATPDAAVSSVNGQTGVVNLTASNVNAAPASHTHTMLQVTDLPALETPTREASDRANKLAVRDSKGRLLSQNYSNTADVLATETELPHTLASLWAARQVATDVVAKNGPKIQIVSVMPSNPDANTLYVVMG